MDKIKNKQTDEIIQTKHKQLQSQQTLNQKQIEEHKQDTTTLKENFNELQLELTEIKKRYAEATANRRTTHKQNKNTTLQKMEKEVTDLKTLVHMMHENNIENNKIITTLQAENKQLNHKIDKLHQQNKRKPIPYMNVYQNLRTVCGHLQIHQNHIFVYKYSTLYTNALRPSEFMGWHVTNVFSHV